MTHQFTVRAPCAACRRQQQGIWAGPVSQPHTCRPKRWTLVVPLRMTNWLPMREVRRDN